MHRSPQFEQALHYAVVIHAGQIRKGTDIPYLGHLLGVASIALDYGATEVEAIGALLHDAGEDAGGRGRIEDIRQRFGHAVADIVQGCTDSEVVPKPEWRKRKEDYIAHLPKASHSVRLVSASDKLHNARSILRDYRTQGEKLWSRFTGRKSGTLWYYRELVRAFTKAERKTKKKAKPNQLIAELNRVVSEIENLSKHDKNDEPYSFSGMQKIVHTMRDKIGLPSTFTLDACRHGGMTELEEAALTDGQGRALSAHKSQQAYEGYAKRTMERALSATRKRHAHRLANAGGTSIQNEEQNAIQNDPSIKIENAHK